MNGPRYTSVAIALHWVMAALLVFMIWLGWNMDDNEARYQLHKSIGITILFLTLARLGWRIFNPPPPLPAGMPRHELLLSRISHIGFYVAMVAMPLGGWLLVSVSPFQVSTVLFGAVSWPHLPFTGGLRTEAVYGVVETLHSKGAWVILALLALHVAGAVKHEIGAEDGVLKRMIPRLFGRADPPAAPPRGALIAFGGSIMLFALIAAIPAFGSSGAAAPQDSEAIVAADRVNWAVDYASAEIRFSGIYDRVPYEGVFREWQADIAFDPEDLEAAEVFVIINAASARTGTRLYDETLREADWFAAARFPQATVHLTDFTRAGEAYLATASVTIKDQIVTVPLQFTLDIEGDTGTLNGTTSLSRRAINLGMGSDPSGEWVADEVVITLSGTAQRLR